MKKLLLILVAFFFTGGLAWGQTLPDNWTGDSGIDTYQETTTVHSGLSSCRVDVNTGSQGSCDMRSATIYVTAGNSYSFSFYVQTSAHVKARAILEWDGASTTYGTNSSISTTSFTQVTQAGTVPSGATGVKLGVRFYDQSGFSAPETQYIDDFTFESPTGTALAVTNGDMESWPSSSGPDNPSAFTSTAASTSEIDLSWAKNGNGDNVMVAWSSDGTFGTPTDGSSYAAGNAISGGGTVIYNGSATTTFSYTGLTSGIHIYYKAWSVDGSTNYSSGVTSDAITLKMEPSNHVTGFSATANGSGEIDLIWTYATVPVTPDGYLIKASTADDITAPVDGTAESDDNTIGDNSGAKNVAQGTGFYHWTGLSPSTPYYFKIYPYTNSGSHIDYKIDGTVPSATTTTGAAAAEPGVGDLKISEVNSTSAAYASYVELYNTTPHELSLEKVDLEFYNNGAGSATTTVHLTGSIAANSYIVIARKTADFNSVYGFDPDFANANIYLNGGADGLILRHDDNGVLDQFNDAPTPTVSWTDNHLFYRFDFSSDGSSLANDWDDAGLNRNGTPKTANKLIWLTTGTTDWGTGSNWSNGDIPSKGVSVVIPSGGTQPSVDGTVANPASCYDLTINSGAVLTVPVSKYLTVYHTLTNNTGNTGLVIQSTSSGTGSLIVNSGSPAATVQRYLTAYSSKTAADGWHLLSSPVANFTIAGSDFEPTSGTDDLYRFDEAATTSTVWLNYFGGSFGETAFQVGEGYLVAYATAGVKTFTGALNTGDVTLTTHSTTGAYADTKGWNLLGNPYTSAIDWDNLTKGSSINGTVYVYDASAKTYDEWNGSAGDLTDGIIPAMQGFFVYTTNDGATITNTAAARVHSSTNYYKSSNALAAQTLKISLSNGQDANNTYLQLRDDATTKFDNAVDGYKLFGYGSVPELYTQIGKTKYSINCLPASLSNYSLPIGLKIEKPGDYTLSFAGLDTFTNGIDLVIEDTKTGEMTPIKAGTALTFHFDANDSPNRFTLHINGTTAVANLKNTDGIQVFSSGNTVYLHGQKALNGKIFIFNTLGQKVYEGLLNGAVRQQIRLNQRTGIYFVRLEENNQVFTQKVFIK